MLFMLTPLERTNWDITVFRNDKKVAYGSSKEGKHKTRTCSRRYLDADSCDIKDLPSKRKLQTDILLLWDSHRKDTSSASLRIVPLHQEPGIVLMSTSSKCVESNLRFEFRLYWPAMMQIFEGLGTKAWFTAILWTLQGKILLAFLDLSPKSTVALTFTLSVTAHWSRQL